MVVKISVLFDAHHNFTRGLVNANQTFLLKTFCGFLYAEFILKCEFYIIQTAFKVLANGDCESKARMMYTVQSSFSEGHPKFGETSAIQCACKSHFDLFLSSVKRVSSNVSKLDKILRLLCR